jgi:hypothetical protein
MPADKSAEVGATSLEIPAQFVNLFQILVSGSNVRIAFAEGFQGAPVNYRAAVMMTAADARQLAAAILTSIPQDRTYSSALAAALTAPNPLSPTLTGNTLNDLLGKRNG